MSLYSATPHVKPEPMAGVQWRRIFSFSVLIVIAVTLVAVLGGVSMARWEIYGSTIEEAVTNARLIRRIGYGVVAAVLYWRLVVPLAGRRWLHVLLAFACVQVLDAAISLTLFQVPVDELIELEPMGRGALAALAGWGLASLSSMRGHGSQLNAK